MFASRSRTTSQNALQSSVAIVTLTLSSSQ
jgi:hypothetical protein